LPTPHAKQAWSSKLDPSSPFRPQHPSAGTGETAYLFKTGNPTPAGNFMADETPDTAPKTAQGADTGAETVTNTDPVPGKPNDGSSPMPARGELEQVGAGAAEPAATADGNQTGAGTSDAEAAATTPDAVLSEVKVEPAAQVGPVVPGGPRTGGGGGGGGQGGGGRGRGGPQRGRGGPRGDRRSDRDEDGVESNVIRIYRCSKVVKGGRTFSFAALVVAGDRSGKIGIGYGKANEVPSAVEKATKEARKSLFKFPMNGTTIPHLVIGKAGSSRVKLVPAQPGTGVTAGKTVRPILELAGLSDVLTKAYGSTSPKNLLKATIDALRQLQSRDEVAQRRGVDLEEGAGELQPAA
jgi:small subunit ribosomal protein S5